MIQADPPKAVETNSLAVDAASTKDANSEEQSDEVFIGTSEDGCGMFSTGN